MSDMTRALRPGQVAAAEFVVSRRSVVVLGHSAQAAARPCGRARSPCRRRSLGVTAAAAAGQGSVRAGGVGGTAARRWYQAARVEGEARRDDRRAGSVGGGRAVRPSAGRARAGFRGFVLMWRPPSCQFHPRDEVAGESSTGLRGGSSLANKAYDGSRRRRGPTPRWSTGCRHAVARGQLRPVPGPSRGPRPRAWPTRVRNKDPLSPCSRAASPLRPIIDPGPAPPRPKDVGIGILA